MSLQTLETTEMQSVSGGALPLAVFFLTYSFTGPILALGVANGISDGLEQANAN